ncbi:MAG: RNA-dependent RNA polymerase [Sanya totivirus 1]|nr:MAG: RNA-dependent RNA polymerase [Sanya totivirus 1]
MEQYGKISCTCGSPGLFEFYPRRVLGLLRYRLDHRHSCCHCKSFPPVGRYVWLDGIHLLLAIAPEDVARQLTNWYALFVRWAEGLCTHDFTRLCKHQSTVVKQAGKYFSQHWHWFVYWELLSTYRPYKDHAEFLPEVSKWLGEKHDNGGNYKEEYYRRLHHNILGLLHDNFKPQVEEVTMEDFVKRGAWMRGKAGTGRKCLFFDKSNNKWCKSRAYRGVESVVYQDPGIHKLLRQTCPDQIFIQQKAEGAKVRPVAKAGNELTRQMDFISSWLDRGLYGSKMSTLFLSASQAEDLDLKFLEDARNPNLLKVPLDQSNFDQHQSYTTIMTCLLAMYTFARERGAPPDVIEVFQRVLCTLGRHDVSIYYDNQRLKYVWNNGLPSGWRWTSLLGTLINIGEFVTITKLCEERYKTIINYHRLIGQGDDLTLCLHQLEHVNMIVQMYNEVGLEINPQKIYVSRYRNEFLRRSIETGGIFGYIPRTLLALRFRNPVLNPTVIKVTRGYAKFTLWHMAILRGGSVKDIVREMANDIQQIPLDVTDFFDYLCTPNAFGGGGIAPNSLLARSLGAWTTGTWKIPRIQYEAKDFRLPLGGWSTRVVPWLEVIGKEGIQELQNTLVMNWGLPESRRVGRVSEEFVSVEKSDPMPISTVFGWLQNTPEPWKDLEATRYLCDIIKRRALQTGNLASVMTQEGLYTYKLIKQRSSKHIADIWATGYWEIPGPTLDHVGIKYGQKVKEWYKKLVSRIFMVRGLDEKKLKRYLYSVEIDLRRQIAERFTSPMSL